jgi:ABC-type antimicrobial peptide transport system permease subunit
MLKHYLIVAFRNLWKYRLQNIVGIIGLSLGFICFSVVVFDIEWKTGNDSDYPKSGRMYILSTEYYSDYNDNIYNLNQAFPEIEKMTVRKRSGKISCAMFDNYKSTVFNHLSKEEKMNIFYADFNDKAARDNKDAIISEISSSSLVNEIFSDISVFNTNGRLIVAEDETFDIPNFRANEIGWEIVSPDFFTFFRCELLDGQLPTKDSSPNDAVVDENFAYYYKDKSPVGELFEGYKIVGVIKSLNLVKLKERFSETKFPVIYRVKANNGNATLYVKSHKGKAKEVEQLINATFQKYVPANRHNWIQTGNFEKSIENELSDERKLFHSMQVLFVISLVICLLGIYSAIVMSTEKRRKEIAIRKIHGTTVKDIIMLFGKTYVGLWTMACIVFFPLVYYFGNRWLEKYLERISLDIVFSQ